MRRLTNGHAAFFGSLPRSFHDDALLSLRNDQQLTAALAASVEDERRRAASSSDEALARALQREMDLAVVPPPVPLASSDEALARRLQAEEAAASRQPSVGFIGALFGCCRGCQGSFGFGVKLSALGGEWHPSCFTCGVCSHPVADRTFNVLPCGRRPAHAACFAAKFGLQCAACGSKLPAGADGTVRFKVTPFWNEKLCLRCDEARVARCDFCRRVQPAAGPSFAPAPGGDGLICLSCLCSSVASEADALPLYRSVASFFAEQGAALPHLPPLRVVFAAQLVAQRGAAISLHGEEERTLGLCLTEERTMALFGGAVPISRTLSVTVALRELLPRLQAGRVLAHELCHAHLALSAPPGAPRLPLRVEEGLCELWSLLWLEAEVGRCESADDAQLGAYLADAVRSNPSPVYGDGVRMALAAWQRVGMRVLMQHARAHGSFP